MSWAAFRQTTRPEDRANSLLGLFDITLPTVYGEGYQAFLRLQEAILTRSPDHSLFAWTLQNPRELVTSARGSRCNPYCILAPSPDCFYSSCSVVPFRRTREGMVPHGRTNRPGVSISRLDQPNELRASSELPYSITNMGLQIAFLATEIGQDGGKRVFQVALNCYDESKAQPCACTIYLVRDVRGVQAQRAEPYYLGSVSIQGPGTFGRLSGPWDWETSQFLVKPIWISPFDSTSMRYPSDSIETENLQSESFLRIREIEKLELRRKELVARKLEREREREEEEKRLREERERKEEKRKKKKEKRLDGIMNVGRLLCCCYLLGVSLTPAETGEQ